MKYLMCLMALVFAFGTTGCSFSNAGKVIDGLMTSAEGAIVNNPAKSAAVTQAAVTDGLKGIAMLNATDAKLTAQALQQLTTAMSQYLAGNLNPTSDGINALMVALPDAVPASAKSMAGIIGGVLNPLINAAIPTDPLNKLQVQALQIELPAITAACAAYLAPAK